MILIYGSSQLRFICQIQVQIRPWYALKGPKFSLGGYQKVQIQCSF